MVILLNPNWRKMPRLQIPALALVVLGLVMYRWDTNMVGQLVVFNYMPQEFVPQFTTYIPSLVEIAAGAGRHCRWAAGLTLGVRYLRIIDHSEVVVDEPVDMPIRLCQLINSIFYFATDAHLSRKKRKEIREHLR